MQFIARVEQLHDILQWIQEQLKPMGLSRETLRHVELAAEEVFVNIVRHAYQGRPEKMEIEVRLFPAYAEVAFFDHGPPFNPLNVERVDPTLPLEKREVGGLGIHLIRKCVSDLRYERLGKQNVLTLIIRSSQKR
ncbi:MAG: anti-sigma regulatory factor [Verrucomicrobia bacterium]|nr:anti-sigma regulatory factor [Verrucomicrobiota bacterium]MBU6446162.1 anti-sigma regulatory factor [Verrucomicrobiota bacterium]MDE3047107.1 ATP-binding protein [Verrucomicrobiota bacterium]